MAITVDVFTKLVDSSVRQTTDEAEKKFTASGQKASEGFSKAFADGVAKSPEMQKAFDKAADAVGKLRVEQEKLNAINAKASSTDAQKIAQAERVEKAKREEARAVREAADAYQRYGQTAENALDRVNRTATGTLSIISNITAGSRFGGMTSALAEIASGFTTAGVAAGSMSASMLAAGAIAAGTVVVGLVAATAATVALTTELYNLGSEFDTAFDSLQVKTGAAGDQLAQLQSIVKDVAGQVPESFGSIADITAEVTQSMKLTTDQTEEVVTALGHLQYMGVDVDVHSLGMAFKALKVDQDDYVSSIEQMLNVNQTTGQSMDSIAAAIEGNAGALSAFGFTFGETLTIIREFEEIGMSPDKGLGALSKAFKALTEAGLDPTKENLQKVFDEIKTFADSGQTTKANEELNALFGPRGGGLSWLPLIQDGTLNLNELADAAEAPGTNINDLADRTYDLSEAMTVLGNDVKGALEPLSTEFYNLVNESMQGIRDWIEDNKPEIIGFFTGLSTQVVNLAQIFTGVLGQALYQIGAAGSLLPDWLGGDKFSGVKDAGQDLMNFSAKLDYMQGKLQEAGDKANDTAQQQRDLADETQAAANATDNLDQALRRAAEAPPIPFTPGAILGTDPNVPTAGDNPFNPGGVLGPGVTGPRKFASGAATNRYEPGMVPNNRNLMDAVTETFGVKAAADTGRRDKFGEHGSGRALDIMVNPGGQLGTVSPEGQMTGDQINQWLLANADKYGLQYTIWQGKQWNPDGTTAPNSGQGITGGHWDHVHAYVAAGASRGGMRKFGPGGTQALSSNTSSSAGMMNYGPQSGGPSPLPPGTPSPIPGLQEGPVGSTFGYNEYGEPGYYRPDADSIRSAEKSKTNADKAVSKAEERLKDLQDKIGELEAQRTTLNSQATDKKIADLQKQIKDQQDNINDLKDNATDAERRLDDARRGRFSAARETPKGRGRSGGMGDIGAPLADDFGLSEGLPGMAQWLTTFLANLAFAPMMGQLAAVSASSPYQGGYGALGVMGAQNMAAGGSPLGLSAPAFPGMGGQSPSSIPGIASGQGTGPAPGPQGPATQNTSMPASASGGGGFQGLGGAPMEAITTAASMAAPALDAVAPGAGQAAQTGIKLANRAIAYGGQLAGIGVSGLLQTFLPNNSPIADPGKSWLGRIAGGFAGARPALPNTAGGDNPAGSSAKPQTPEEAAALQAQNGGGQGNGPMVNIENMVNQTPDGGQTVANQLARQQMTMHMSGGPR